MKKENGKRVAFLVGTVVLVVAVLVAPFYHGEIATWFLLLTRFERLADNDQGYAEYLHDQSGVVFVRLPVGTFGTTGPKTKIYLSLPRISRCFNAACATRRIN